MPGSTSNDTPFDRAEPAPVGLGQVPHLQRPARRRRRRPCGPRGGRSTRPASQPSSASPSTTPIPITGPSGTVLAVTGSPGHHRHG